MGDAVHIETAFNQLGGLGAYQQRVTLLALVLPWIITAIQSQLPIYASRNFPDSWGTSSESGPVASFFSGWALGALVLGGISEQVGRRRTLIASAGITAVGASCVPVFHSYPVYIALQCIVGVGCGGLDVVGWTLGSEWWGSDCRTSASILSQGGFAIGIAISAAVGWALPQKWWLLSAVGLPFLALWFSLVCLLPESPRWLLVHEMHPEATRLLQQAAAYSNVPGMTHPNWAVQPVSTPPTNKLGLLCSKLRLESCLLSYLWLAVSFVFFFLVYATPSLDGGVYQNVLTGAAIEFVGLPAAVGLAGYGRREALIGFLATNTVISVVAAVSPQHSAQVTVVAIIGRFSSQGAFAVLYLYTTEAFPTEVRNLAIGVCSQWARFGAIAAPLLVGLGRGVYGACGAMSLLGAVVIWALKETVGHGMEDTIGGTEYSELAVQSDQEYGSAGVKSQVLA
eukprot:TRINITY_DN20425_c0_g1_i2.p1 TRINITY_DN20425_c0_g1~~TRINITY_DN20425_c0_g1_i2.p1  ORF type:complete len:454 (-),score=49.64 TRINITY_DN20425_c0_g1_i2:247-1608(-)